MSRFADAVGTSHTLSLAAMEEASRVGLRTAGIDHLLLALTVNDQDAGQVLRALGVTLEPARAAVAEQHAELLASLGVHSANAAPGRIVFHETGGYEWDAPALAILTRASGGGKAGDAAAVLRELVAEPSGMIASVLGRLGTSPESVIAELEAVERYPVPTRLRAEPGDPLGLAGETFVPAPPERVWELLADPARLPEWEPGIGGIEHAPALARAGDTWTALARTEQPDGKPIRVRPGLGRQRIELLAADAPRRIEWRHSYPELPRANTRFVAIELEPAAGGTRMHLRLVWERHPSRRGRTPLRFALRPLRRLVLRMQLAQLGAGISRVFR